MNCYVLYHLTGGYYCGGGRFSADFKHAKLYKKMNHARNAWRYVERALKLTNMQIIEFDLSPVKKHELG